MAEYFAAIEGNAVSGDNAFLIWCPEDESNVRPIP